VAHPLKIDNHASCGLSVVDELLVEMWYSQGFLDAQTHAFIHSLTGG